jgi:hypothetical protein
MLYVFENKGKKYSLSANSEEEAKRVLEKLYKINLKPVYVKGYSRIGKKVDKESSLVSQIRVGDIFVNTWGYEQTNADFYKVINKSKTFVKLRKLKDRIVEDKNGFMTGSAFPVDEFDSSEPEVFIKKPYLFMGRIYVRMKYGSAERWDGTPVRISWYG